MGNGNAILPFSNEAKLSQHQHSNAHSPYIGTGAWFRLHILLLPHQINYWAKPNYSHPVGAWGASLLFHCLSISKRHSHELGARIVELELLGFLFVPLFYAYYFLVFILSTRKTTTTKKIFINPEYLFMGKYICLSFEWQHKCAIPTSRVNCGKVQIMQWMFIFFANNNYASSNRCECWMRSPLVT